MVVAAVDVIRRIQRRVRPRHDDGLVDRLHYVLAPAALMCMACFHGLKQYFGKPVECWTAAEFRRPWLKYIHGYCFIENTYFVGFNEHYPMRRVDRDSRAIHYYLWVPFLLLGQALLLILPKALWYLFSTSTGYNIGLLLDRFRALESRDPAQQGRRRWVDDQAAARGLARQLGRAHLDRICFRRGIDLEKMFEQKKKQGAEKEIDGGGKKSSQTAECAGGEKAQMAESQLPKKKYVPAPVLPPRPSWLSWITAHFSEQCFTLSYLAYKLANLFVVLFQIHLLNTYIDGAEQYTFWGIGVLLDLLGGRDWRESGLFPRVTFCDLEVRQPQRSVQPHRYSFQCLLNMNLFNEKIYLAIWFGLAALAIVGTLDLIVWIRRWLSWHSAEQFIREELNKLDFRTIDPELCRFPEFGPRELRHFVRRSLGPDIVTVLRIIRANCPPMVTAQLIGHLWHFHRKGCTGFRDADELIIGIGKNPPKNGVARAR